MTTNIFALIIVLGVLVFFHELGHFLVARYFNVGVEKFSLGFGPRLFGKTIGMTEYRVSAIPLGGYVKMVGEDPDADLDEKDIAISFSHKNVWQRIAIVAAGPVFNFILAIVIYFLLFVIIGYDASRPVAGVIETDSPAAEAGMMQGDIVTIVNGAKITVWEEISKALEKTNTGKADIVVSRNGKTIHLSLTPATKTITTILGDQADILYIGVSPHHEQVLVDQVLENTPAEKSALKKGDQILFINGETVGSLKEASRIIGSSNGKELDFKIQRGIEKLTLKITPEKISTKEGDLYRIGIQMGYDTIKKRLGVIDAFNESLNRTWLLTVFMGKAVYKMAVRQLPGSDLGGPILIAKMAGDQARAGIDRLISFIALISINLAILNLLPIPVLDGGHLLFYSIEIIRRRPVSIKTREIASMLGMSLLMLLTVYVFYNDIMRFVMKN